MDLPQRLVRLGEWIKRRYSRVPYDASEHAAEAYYATVYLEIIRGALASLGERPLRIFCAGCGTGRIAIPLAEDGHDVTGVDRFRDALRVARRRGERVGVSVRLVDSDMLEAASSLPAGSFDAVLGIESMYMTRDLPDLVGRLSELLRPGGLFVGTHRTRFYYVLYCLARGRFDEALSVVNDSSGELSKGPVRFHYNWQTAAELEALYGGTGLRILDRHPIGPYSGFGYDPLASICDPGALTPAQRETLRHIEMTADPDTVMSARYVLVLASKDPPATPE